MKFAALLTERLVVVTFVPVAFVQVRLVMVHELKIAGEGLVRPIVTPLMVCCRTRSRSKVDSSPGKRQGRRRVQQTVAAALSF